jgi:tetratricopeptide (TPR) repeat protein
VRRHKRGAENVDMPPETKREPDESDLLVPFEIQNIPAPYREYYSAKRKNFFNSIQSFPDLWRYYISLDRIWLRAFDDLKAASEPSRMFPLLLYFNAHAKMRVSIELGFSGCLAEARSILRDAIEFVAHAHAMLQDAELQKVWLNRNDGKTALEAFKRAFEHHKKENLFKGLDELHRTWGQLSELGSHANLNALCDRFVKVQSEEGVEFRVNYTGLADRRLWAMSLFSMLLACFTMEGALFSDYVDQLKLDPDLERMRADFERYKERLRRELIRRYDVKPPKSMPSIRVP